MNISARSSNSFGTYADLLVGVGPSPSTGWTSSLEKALKSAASPSR